MRGHKLFIVFTQYQLLNAVNCALNESDANEFSKDILLDQALYKIMPKGYKKALNEVFESIYEADCWHHSKFSFKNIKRLSLKYEYSVLYLFIYIKNLIIESIAHLIYKKSKTAFLRFRIGNRFNPLKYNELYMHNISDLTKTIFELLYINKIRSVHIIEDGMDSYNSQYQAEFLSRTFKGLKIYTHLYDPDLISFKNPVSSLIPLPKLSTGNSITLKHLNDIFAYKEEHALKEGIEFIILDQNLERCLQVGSSENKDDILKKKLELYEIAIDVLADKVLFKKHPMSLHLGSAVSYSLKNAVMDPNINKYPLEIIILNSSKCPGLISIFSTASFTPYYAFEDDLPEFRLIVLDRFFRLGKIHSRFNNVEKFIDKLEGKYNFYRPSTIAEYKDILRSFS